MIAKVLLESGEHKKQSEPYCIASRRREVKKVKQMHHQQTFVAVPAKEETERDGSGLRIDFPHHQELTSAERNTKERGGNK